MGANAWGAAEPTLTLTSSYAVDNYSKLCYIDFGAKTIDDESTYADVVNIGGYTASTTRGIQNQTASTATTPITLTKSVKKGDLIILQAGQTAEYGMSVTVSSTVSNPIKNDGYYVYYVTSDVESFTIKLNRLNYVRAMLVLRPSNDTYVVNAVTSDGTFLKQIATDTYSADATVYYPVCVEKDGVIYRKDANAADPYWAFTNIAAGLRTIVYTATDYVYYSEVENMTFDKNGSGFDALRTDKATNSGRYSGGVARNFYGKQLIYTSALPLGVYSVTLYARNGGSGDRSGLSIKLRDSEGTYGDELVSLGTWTSSQCAEKTVTVLVPATSNICIYESTGYNSDIQIDYVYVRKLYDVTDASKVIGAVDYSTGFMGAATESLALAKGKKVTYTFKNHGSGVNNYNKWAFEMSGTYNDNTSVYTWCGGSHVWVTTDAGNANTTSVTTDGAAMDWTIHNAEMKDGDVTLTAYYYDNGIFTVKSTDIGTAHTYNTWFAFDNAQSGNINVRLGVDGAWLEMVSSTTGEDAATVDVTIGSAGWATLYTPAAVSFEGSGLTAYTATYEGSTVTLTEVKNVPANTGVVLKGAAGNYNLPVTTSTTAQGSLQGSIAGATFYDAGTDRYMLALNDNNEAQFTKMGEGFITAGKAFLVVAGAGARSLKVVFADESTGIKSIENSQMATDNYYNLRGQRVSAPTKGLYIINGKKVIMK